MESRQCQPLGYANRRSGRLRRSSSFWLDTIWQKESRNFDYYTNRRSLIEQIALDVEGLAIPVGTKAIGFDGLPEDQQVELKTEETQSKSLILPPYSIRVIEL